MGIATHSVVYFFADRNNSKELSGWGKWLDRVRLGVVDYDCALYLATYDSEAQ